MRYARGRARRAAIDPRCEVDDSVDAVFDKRMASAFHKTHFIRLTDLQLKYADVVPVSALSA